jgi:multiple sugar transport system permease protein
MSATVTSGAPDAAGAPARSRPFDAEKLFNRVAFAAALAFALLWLVPLAWALATSLRSNTDISDHPTAWTTSHPTAAAYRQIWDFGNLPHWYVNSAVTATLTTALTVLFGSMAGFALSRMRFTGRRVAAAGIWAGVMIPPQVLMIPQFKELAGVHALDSYWAVVLPQIPNAIAVVVFKRFFDGIPDELLEAARVDGASWGRVYWRVFMPLSRPVVSAVAIFSFVWAWNNFLWPLLATNSPDMMTLPVGIATVQEAYGVNYAQLMASAVLGAVPLLFVFLLFQRRIVEGIAGTGLK